MIRPLAMGIVLMCLLPGIAATGGVKHSYRYAAGTYSERALISQGGACTAARVWDGDSFVDSPVVVGGVCFVDLADARTVTVSVVDDAWASVGFAGDVSFRWELWGGSAPHVTCAHGGTAWGEIRLDVPPGCDRLSVFLGDFATTGTIAVVGA